MNSALLRTLVIYAIILPLAVFVGWMAVDLANWDRTSFAVFSAILFVLLLPVILKWHYPVMVFSWNTAITIFFLPGKPGLWMLMVGLTFGFAVLNRVMQKRSAFLSAPSITVSLLALLMIVLVTAKLRGGIGVQALGGSLYGGKGYIFTIAAILGYFAFASRKIPPERAKLYVTMFFLPGAISAVSTLIYLAGPAFYFLYVLFPVGYAGVQAITEYGGGAIVRVAGFSVAASAVSYYLMAMYGIRGILSRWWLIVLLAVTLFLGALGGYRSLIAAFAAVFIILFLIEGLHRSPIFPALLLIGGLGIAALIPVADNLPLSVQRTFSFLPVQVNPIVKHDADASIAWRVEIWRAMLPDLPKYFWLGKGYAINPTDMYLAEQAVRRGRAQHYESTIVNGDYHSGPLSTYVPFGIFGVLAVVAFMGASIRALYRNYRYGAESLRTYNRFLFAYFVGQLLFFVFGFGAFSVALAAYTGTVGLSIALNGGICRKPEPQFQPQRAQLQRRTGLEALPAAAS